MLESLVILAGGKGSRLYPYTTRIPKSLVSIGGKPFILHQIDLLKLQGIKDIVLCVGHMGEIIEHSLGDGKKYGVNISYSYDGPSLVGTAGAIIQALHLLREDFIVLYGDSYLRADFRPIIQKYYKEAKTGLLTIYHNNNSYVRSNIMIKNSKIFKYRKATYGMGFEYIDYGLSIFNKSAFDCVPLGKHSDLSVVFDNLIERDDLAYFEVPERFYEIGTLEGLKETEKHIIKISNGE